MHAKTVGRLAGVTWLAVAFVFANTTGPMAITPAGASDVSVSSTKALSGAAQNQAQAYLDRFYKLSTVSEDAARQKQALVQVALNGSTVWAVPVAVSESGYSAALQEDSPLGKDGDVIVFKKENVRDWSFRGRNKVYYGEFQMRAKLSLLSREEAALKGTRLTRSPVPPGW